MHGIGTKRRKQFKVTTHSKYQHWIAPNLLQRNFYAAKPNQVWVGDVMFIATRTGWLYLAQRLICIHVRWWVGLCLLRTTKL